MSTLKKMKVIESNQLDFHPEQNLSEKDLQNINGGLCNYLKFMINDWCACNENCFLKTGKGLEDPVNIYDPVDPIKIIP